MHKASDLGTNIYKIGADRNSLNFDFMLLHFFPTSPKEEFDFYERRGIEPFYRPTIMQPGRVTTSLKRLFPPRISNRCSNGWSQRCNGAILHYLRLISRGRDYHSIPSNFTTQLRHAFEGGAVHRPNYPLNEARTRAIYIYIYIENGKRFQSKVTPKQLFPSACPFNGGYSFFPPPLFLSLSFFFRAKPVLILEQYFHPVSPPTDIPSLSLYPLPASPPQRFGT